MQAKEAYFYLEIYFLRLVLIGIIIISAVYDTLLAILLSIAFIFTHIKYQKINSNNLNPQERQRLEQFIDEK